MPLNIDDLTIGQVKEIAAMLPIPGPVPVNLLKVPNDRLAPDGEIRIAALQRGHVIIGKYSQEGETGHLENASVVRRWGTSKGLGELAQKGPLDNTVLDECPRVSFHVREVIFLMEVNKDAWRERCN